jgi:hypothetical protein
LRGAGPRARAAAVAMLGGCGAILVAPRAAADSINFNAGPADFTDNFTVNFDGTPVSTDGDGNFIWDAHAGVADNNGNSGGGLLTTSNDATALYVGPNHDTSVRAFRLTSGASLSVMFLGTDLVYDHDVQIGFLNKFNSSLNNDTNDTDDVDDDQRAVSAATAFLSVRVYATGQLEQMAKSSGDSAGHITVYPGDPIETLVDNEWYKLTFSVTETTTGTFSMLTTLDDYGANGTSLRTHVYTQTTPTIVTVSGFDDDNNDLGAGNALSGVRQYDENPQIDNFAVNGTAVQVQLPEPVSLGLLALAAAGLLARRRRRHSGDARGLGA